MKLFSAITTLALGVALSCGVAHAQQNPKEWALQNYEQYSQEASEVSDAAKQSDIELLRARFHKGGWRKSKFDSYSMPVDQMLSLMNEDGTFSDLNDRILEIMATEDNNPAALRSENEKLMSEVWDRLANLGDAVPRGRATHDEIYTEKFMRSVVYYSNLEISRSNYVPRFHVSCFAIPTATMNIYYAFMDRMEEIEAGADASELEREFCKLLKVVSLQAWTQPIRKDFTDADVSSVDRFRKHVWWVGGNGLAYRSLLPIACMIKSIPMIDVLAEVAQKGISPTSQVTYDTSFWTEGFTADGAGWGHGMQCLIWGYPIDGTSAALSLLSTIKGTQWAQKLSDENRAAIFNYLQGSNWYYYKGYTLPCLDRGSFSYKDRGDAIKAYNLVKTINADWIDSFTAEEQEELKRYSEGVFSEDMFIDMEGYEDGLYNGTRYFFNNDDLIKKNEDYHIIVNMASVRCDGIESAPAMADGYNFATCDGMTLFQREGDEYMKIYGAFDVLRSPGITARLGMDKLEPVTNWRGYCSKHNYAGAATLNGENAVAGYNFEKMNGSDKEGVNDRVGAGTLNEVLYGVTAHKGYFIIGDYMLALGVGVTNLKAEMEGDIHTSIEQTSAQNEIYTLKGGKKSAVESGVHKFNSDKKSLEWLVQDGKFAYTALPEYSAEAYYSLETRDQDWVKMNITNARRRGTPSKAEVLSAWVDHGAAPKDDTYGYVVYMGEGEPASKLPISVLRNDTQIQAAMSSDGKVIEAVFYNSDEALKVSKKLSVEVSEPAIVLMEATADGWDVSITDPQMRADLKSIDITISGKKYSVEMPADLYCGKPAKTTIKTK